MDELEKYLRKLDETIQLSHLYFSANPAKRNNSILLKHRWKLNDPNVVKVDHGEYGESYELIFTKEQKEKLKRGFTSAHPKSKIWRKEDLDHEAMVFISIIQSFAANINYFQSAKPEKHRERKREIESINVALKKFNEALKSLDGEALGYWFAHVIDAIALTEAQQNGINNSVPLIADDPLLAIVSGGEFRNLMQAVIPAIVKATENSVETLPKFDHIKHDDRVVLAVYLERQMIESGLNFDASDNGFAAECLREMYALAGIDFDKVTYWIQKVKGDPDSFANFLQNMRNRIA